MCDKIGGLLYEICRNLITIPTNVIINCAKRMARDISAGGVKRNSRAERELGSRETLRVAIGRFHKKKHRCRGAICATCLAGGRRKESGNGITILSSGWKEGRKEEGGGRGGGKGQEEYEGATSHGGGHSSFRGLHLVVFYSSAHREYATLLFRRDAVPDICCSLSSSPQQGICIIIISPRPSRKLELRTGATIRIRSFGPVVVVVVVVKERGGGRVERKGRTAKLASVNHDAYRGKNNLKDKLEVKSSRICIDDLPRKKSSPAIESSSRTKRI